MGNELFLEINDNNTQGSHATSPDLAFIERRMTNPRWLLQQFLESSKVKSNHCWRFSTISHTTTYTKERTFQGCQNYKYEENPAAGDPNDNLGSHLCP